MAGCLLSGGQLPVSSYNKWQKGKIPSQVVESEGLLIMAGVEREEIQGWLHACVLWAVGLGCCSGFRPMGSFEAQVQATAFC